VLAARLLLEHLALDVRVVLLGVGGRDLHAADAELEDVEGRGVLAVNLGEGAELLGQVEDERRLYEVWLYPLREYLVRDLEVLPARLDPEAHLLGRGDVLGLALLEPRGVARLGPDQVL